MARWLGIAAICSGVTLAGPVASATAGTVTDPADTAGPLDLAAASALVRTERPRRARGRLLVLRARTYQPWNPSDIARDGVGLHGFAFEFSGAGEPCFVITAQSTGTVVGQMYRQCFPIRFDEVGPAVRVSRPGPRQARAVLPLRWLGREPAERRWRAAGSFEASGDPDCAAPQFPPPEHLYSTCLDYTRWTHLKG